MNNIIVSKANGTEVSGIIGDIWNTLSEFMNFTLKPIRSTEHSLGSINESSGTYTTGLLRYIQDNETDVLPRIEAYNKRLRASQFTIPLWKARCLLYFRREVKHLPTWMVKLFSRRVWYAILTMHFLLSVCSYLSQSIDWKVSRKRSKANFYDHIFYNFGMICGQSYLPSGFSKSSRVVELWLGLFSLLVRTAFSALLISYMTRTVITPPFHDINSLLYDTKYKIVTKDGSLPSLIFKLSNESTFKWVRETGRVVYLNSAEKMYKAACSTKSLHAMIQSEDIKMANGMYFCPLNPVGPDVLTAWIVSAISRNFTYKRSIDVGILKLHQFGFINLFWQRWISANNVEETQSIGSEPIVMDQVYLILSVYFCGLLISFAILVVENVTYYYRN
ncbi:uncharacterized protein LOC143375831 isoform X2 [Andrena cerasifolii]